jgi:hypothetical protein
MSCYGKFVSAKRVGDEPVYEKMKMSHEFTSMVNKSIVGDSSEFILKKLLLLPMQRLMQYSLLIEKLVKHTDEGDDDYQNLKMALRQLVDLIQLINTEVGKKDEMEKLAWLDEHVNLKGIVIIKIPLQLFLSM